MTLTLYATCFGVALVGMALQTVLKLKSLQDKARAANLTFKPGLYFREDWLSITASVLTIILFLLFLDNILKWKPVIVDYIKIGFAFVGYTGSDIASRLFSVVNKKINDVIDVKTNIADAKPYHETHK
jgi:amino acid permease